ncbi:MAG: S8 family serine peptidase, partial [Pseudoflavonifractor sp.]
MRLRRILSLCLTLLLCSSWAGAVAPAPTAEQPQTPEYVFKWAESAPMLLCADNSAQGIAPIPYADGYFTANTLEELQPLVDAGLVEYAVPNAALTLFTDPLPNDPDLSQQWYVDSLGASAAWAAGLDGTGVTVAVIDSGLYSAHEDLDQAKLTGRNFLGGTTNDPTKWEDTLGHGTLVGGILAAQKNNQVGIAGLAGNANVLALRCFASATSGSADSGSGSVSVILKAIGYAMTQNVDVINMSFGGENQAVLRPLQEKLQEAAEQGILLVAAAGNGGNSTNQYPAAFSCVTGVGNVRSDGSVAPTSQRNDSVYVTAPGSAIYGLGYQPERLYRSDSGTSFSAPMVAALGVFAKQADPAINNDGFRALLRECAEDKGKIGYDTDYGYGVVSARRLV